MKVNHIMPILGRSNYLYGQNFFFECKEIPHFIISAISALNTITISTEMSGSNNFQKS